MAHPLFDTFEPLDQEDGPAPNRAAAAALVLGVLSLLLSVITGIPAIIAGVVGLARARSLGAGAIKSAVGLVLGVGSLALGAVAVNYLLPVYATVEQVREYQAQGLPAADSPQAQQGIAQAKDVLAQTGVDPSSVICGDPQFSGTDIAVDCTGQTLTGGAADITATCPAPSLLGGTATCEAVVNGEATSVQVTLRDGMPTLEIL